MWRVSPDPHAGRGLEKRDVRCRRGHTCARLSFVFTPVFRLSQQQVKLLQIIARGQPLQLSLQCCLMRSAPSLRNFKFLLFYFISFSIICIIPFVPAAFYTDTKWRFLMDGSTKKGLILSDWSGIINRNFAHN